MHAEQGTRTRIYAPVGRHADLLAYLVRRLLENGANCSFVHQLADRRRAGRRRSRDDPFEAVGVARLANPAIAAAGRSSAAPRQLARLRPQRPGRRCATCSPTATGFRRQEALGAAGRALVAAARPSTFRSLQPGQAADVGRRRHRRQAGRRAGRHRHGRDAAAGWATALSPSAPRCLRQVADLYEANAAEFFALRAREAGKTLADARRRSARGGRFPALLRRPRPQAGREPRQPRGVVRLHLARGIFRWPSSPARSPRRSSPAIPCWPSPPKQTPLIAAPRCRADARGRHPRGAWSSCCPAPAPSVGTALTSDPRIDGVVFTGSLATAKPSTRQLADHLAARRPADRRDRRPQRHDRRLHRAARAGGARHPRLRLPVAPASAARRCASSTCRRTWRSGRSKCSTAPWTS